MRVGALIIAVVFLLILVFFMRMQVEETPHFGLSHTTDAVARINEHIFRIEIADTNEKRSKGLSGRKELPSDAGLLFVFEQDGLPGFWMKGMLFPLDIIWMDENYTVVDITSEITPDSFPEIFYPHVPARYALEVNAGVSRALGINIGDVFEVTF